MKHFMIVGGSSGIGRELASLLSVQNNISILSRRAPGLSSDNITHYPVDIAAEQPAFPEIEGPLHGIVYCPGSIRLKPFTGIQPSEFTEDWNLNVLGAIKTLRRYFPALKAAAPASVVLFSSVAATTGMPYHASVAAVKAALEGLTRSLAAEWAPHIRVNIIAPALVETPLSVHLLNTDAKRKASEERHPLKRIGSAQEIAEIAAWLLDDRSGFVTGTTIHADGGMPLKSI